VESGLSLAPSKNVNPYLKNKLKSRGLGCGSSGRVLAGKYKALSLIPSSIHENEPGRDIFFYSNFSTDSL
jgi:hypothetical protein